MEGTIKPIISRYKNKDWKFAETTEIPEWIKEALLKENAFRSGSPQWYIDTLFFNSKEKKFMIVFNDGWYYKVNAEFALWYINEQGNLVLQCCWSHSHLKRTMRSIIENGHSLPDPGYTT